MLERDNPVFERATLRRFAVDEILLIDVRALRHPALGLAMILIGLAQLPSQMMTVAQVVILDRGGDMELWHFLLPLVAAAVVSALQVATGWAVMMRRHANVVFAIYVAACVGLTIVMSTVARGEEPLTLSIVLAAAVETLGLPVLVAIASLVYTQDELEETWSFVDVSTTLLMFAVHAIVITAIDVLNFAHLSREAHMSVSDWLSVLLYPTIGLAVGVVAAFGSRSKKGVLVYVIVAAGVSLVLAVLTIGWTLATDDNEMVRRFLVVDRILGMVGLLGPFAIWWYMTRSVVDGRRGARVALWIALSYVPTLVARLCVSPDLASQLGHASATLVVVIALALAFVLVATGHSGLRRLPAIRLWASIAAVTSVVISIAAGVYAWRATSRFEGINMLAPLGNLVASTVIVAWRGAA